MGLTTKEIRDKVAYKAISALKGIDNKLNEYAEPMPNVTDEQRQIVIEHLEREREVWTFILNSAS